MHAWASSFHTCQSFIFRFQIHFAKYLQRRNVARTDYKINCSIIMSLLKIMKNSFTSSCRKLNTASEKAHYFNLAEQI